jgi:hypothetical protein
MGERDYEEEVVQVDVGMEDGGREEESSLSA